MTLKERISRGNESFDQLYTQSIQEIAVFHFTLVEVALAAAAFLVDAPTSKVLDIGAGAGKFCLIGAATTNGHFTGIELRTNLVNIAQDLSKEYRLNNTTFIKDNITNIDFKDYSAFYHFNAFYENIDPSGEIDQAIPLDKKLYTSYSQYVKDQLRLMPVGTKLATYFSYKDEVPTCYKVVKKLFDGKLIFWEKQKSELILN